MALLSQYASGYFIGNIIPHTWYHKFTDKRGAPDLTSLSILSEIVYWYRPDKDGKPKFKEDAWQTCYGHFEDKFKFYHEKVRRAFILLEEKGVIRRELRTVNLRGQKYTNRLFM